MTQILEGVRVLEVAIWTYVPIAGAILAEWGADVIKVEHPETGDPQRGLIAAGILPPGQGGVDYMIELPNRGKRSIGIDLRSSEGRDVLLKLAATSDVFLTNFLPPARKKLGIDVADIRAVNPNIIYVRGSGQGQRGPEADRGGYDGCTFWARGGIADSVTPPEVEYPIPMPIPAFGDVTGGLTIAGGIGAALFHRERTGEALIVDNSLLATAMWASGSSIIGAEVLDVDRLPPPPRDQVPNPVASIYRTSDGRFISLVMLESDRYWPELMTTVGRPELIDDLRFNSHGARADNRQACVAVLDEIFGARTFAEWKELLMGVQGVWAPVQTMKELLDDPQAVANGYLPVIETESGATFRSVASPLQFNEEHAELRRAPNHGEHTDEVLLDLGYDMDAVIDLKIKGAVL